MLVWFTPCAPKELTEDLAVCDRAWDSDRPGCADDPGCGISALRQISMDIFRTRPEMDFFGRRIHGDSSPRVSAGLGVNCDLTAADIAHPQRHYDALARILLTYARLNPGVRYVQGMNDLCAPLYYLFAQDPVNSDDAEADTFFCFSLMMIDMRDSFVDALDHTEDGLLGQISRFSSLLRVVDVKVGSTWSRCRYHPYFMQFGGLQ